MNTDSCSATTTELKQAFRRSGLWRLGYTYERAINIPLLLTSLTCLANAARRTAARAGQHTPTQMGLI